MFFEYVVLYAPQMSLKLDVKRKCTQSVVWSKERDLPVPLMDIRSIFYPETCSYRVYSLSDGMGSMCRVGMIPSIIT